MKIQIDELFNPERQPQQIRSYTCVKSLDFNMHLSRSGYSEQFPDCVRVLFSWWCSCLLCAVRWASHTASSKEKQDWVDSCTERPVPLSASHRPTRKSQIILESLVHAQPLAMMSEFLHLNNHVVSNELFNPEPKRRVFL